jgi:hypothetical protein
VEIPKSIDCNNILLVEGIDEVNLFKALFLQRNITNIQIIPLGGKDQFRPKLPELVKIPGFRQVSRIGILRDADVNAKSAFISITDALNNASLPYPSKINIWSQSKPSVGTFILPNCKNQGCLESLCLSSLSNPKILDCIEQYLKCLKRQGNIPRNIHKAKMLAWLSGQEEIVNSIGLAAQKKYFDFDSPGFAKLIGFIDKLAK